MLSRITAYVSLSNIEHNVSVLRAHLRPQTKIMAAVKADAYGHGVSAVAKKLFELGIDCFAVSCINEALELRAVLPQSEILVLGFTHPEHAKTLSENNITQALYGAEFAAALSRSCRNSKVSLKTHIVFDTGMGRIGFTDINSAIEAARLPGISVEGAFTHFSCADGIDEKSNAYTQMQYQRFCNFLKGMEDAGISIKIKHCANSAAAFRYPEYQMDMVRAGVVLYGLAPNVQDSETYRDLRPAMQLKAPISHVKTILKGDCISYGATFTAPKEMRIATVPCGYADGYHRCLGAGSVLVCGKRAKIVGRVCMDQMMIDVTDIPKADFLTPVTLFGKSGEAELSVNELAEISGTINYQLICDVSKRVVRVYE